MVPRCPSSQKQPFCVTVVAKTQKSSFACRCAAAHQPQQSSAITPLGYRFTLNGVLFHGFRTIGISFFLAFPNKTGSSTFSNAPAARLHGDRPYIYVGFLHAFCYSRRHFGSSTWLLPCDTSYNTQFSCHLLTFHPMRRSTSRNHALPCYPTIIFLYHRCWQFWGHR